MAKKKSIGQSLDSYQTTGTIKREGKLVSDTFTPITDSVLLSEAFHDLKPHEQILYIAMRSQEYGKRKPCRDYMEGSVEWERVKSDKCFYFPRSMAERYCKRYAHNNHNRLYKDIGVLVQHGFIDIVISGKADRSKSVYAYSDRWHHWRKPP